MARGQGVGEEFRGKVHHVVQRLAPLLVTRGIGCYCRQRHARHLRQPLDGLAEADALGLHQEGDDVAVLAGREVVVKTLLVVDRERRRLLLLKRRQAFPLPPRLLQLHAPADDFRNRKPGAQLVEELGRKAHKGFCVSRGRLPTDHRYRVACLKYEDYWPFPGYSQGKYLPDATFEFDIRNTIVYTRQ